MDVPTEIRADYFPNKKPEVLSLRQTLSTIPLCCSVYVSGTK